MRTYSLKLASLAVLALMMALFAPLRALADDDDPPSRVARLGYMHGSVSFQPAGTDDWVSAVVNRPITTGDKLWADTDSRAELHIGSASLRISSNTGFSFLNLTDAVTQIQLTSGSLRVRVKRLDENETFEIDTPNLAFSVLRPGTYRINVNEGGDATIIKVRGGEGEVTGGGSAFTVHAQEVGTFNGTDQLTADVEGYQNDDDDFDAWCADRDRHEDLSQSARYVSPDVIGYQDLDGNGDWRPVPEYGTVWFPRTTVVGWAPYHYGHWAYVYPWGYTWIDDAPWGFAPFHYGRWINYGGVWGWVPAPPPAPGVVYVRPVYAPALVAWVGGPHFSVGVSVGGGFAAGVNVGWFPLGPREVFVPSYPVSRTYVTNVNVSNTTVNTTVVNNYYNTTIVNRNTTVINNTTVVQQTYVNQRVAGAVTATTPQAFTSAQPVARNVVRVDVREVASAPVNAFTPPVPPAKQAVLGAGAGAVVRPPVAVQARAVVAKVPPPPPPVPFARQQQAIQANGGRPLAVSQVRQIQPQNVQVAHPMVKLAPPSKPVTPQNVQDNRPGQPQNTGGNAGNGNSNRKTFDDRPPSSRPSGNSATSGNNNSPSGNSNVGAGNNNNAGGGHTKFGGNTNPANNGGSNNKPAGNNNNAAGGSPGSSNASGGIKPGSNSSGGSSSAGSNNKPAGNNNAAGGSPGSSNASGGNNPGGSSGAGGNNNKPSGNNNASGGGPGNNNASSANSQGAEHARHDEERPKQEQRGKQQEEGKSKPPKSDKDKDKDKDEHHR
jgi:hypothetical protein